MDCLRKESGLLFLEMNGRHGGRRYRKLAEALCEGLCGRRYITQGVEAAALGLCPFYVQAIHNNYTKGLEALSFSCDKGKLTLTVTEADEEHVLPIGFDKPEYADLRFHGEPERAAITGELAEDEDGLAVLTVRVSLLELAAARIIRFRFYRDKLVSRWYEQPGKGYLLESLRTLMDTSKRVSLIGTLLSKMDDDLIQFKVAAMLEPEITLHASGEDRV
jgi:hypothetical protein